MRPRDRARAALLALLVLPAPPAAPLAGAVPEVTVSLSPPVITVGDRVEAVLTLRVPAGTPVGEPRFPVFRDTWGEAELLERGEPAQVDSPPTSRAGAGAVVTWRQRLVITAFRTGAVRLPPVAIAVPVKERTLQALTPAGLTLQVRSVLPLAQKGKDPRPKPAAPLRRLPVGERFWLSLAALLAASGGLGWLLWRRARRGGAAAPVAAPVLPPLAELLRELDLLAAGAGHAANAAEAAALPLAAAHTRLSFALRRYLGRTLSFRAVESTTSEVQRQLLSRRIPAPLVRRAAELLRGCDLVKFARQPASADRLRERIAAGRGLAAEVERLMHPETAAPGERLEAAG